MKKYRPSNSTEGDVFRNRFCARCHFVKSCRIPETTMFYTLDDPKYPEEWQWVAGSGICTKFQTQAEWRQTHKRKPRISKRQLALL